MPAVTVIGVGNVILGDDAFGPQVVRRLQAFYQFGPAVSLLDADVATPNLGSRIAGCQTLIVVKALNAEGRPGELRLFRPRQPATTESRTASTADLGLDNTLESLDRRGASPTELLVIGVIAEETGVHVGMTPNVNAAVPLAVEHVLRELARLGYPPQRSWTLSTPDLSWEQLEEVN